MADQFEGWSPPRDVLTSVQAVPTIFPQIDVATRVGGWPTQRLALVHGKSNHGKTQMLHGLGLSFLLAGGFYLLVDAEFTTDDTWLRKLMGDQLDSPAFQAQRPRNYEQTIDATRSALDSIIRARQKGDLAPDVPTLLGVDSLVKLVPRDLLAKVRKALEDAAAEEAAAPKGRKPKDGGVDGARGRGAMIQAMWNGAWFKGLTSTLYEANASMTVITREAENVGAQAFEPEYKLRGGRDVQFESSLTGRVTRSSWVKQGDQIVGERHCVEFSKTKIGGKDDRTIVAHFHSSNGAGQTPEGFDRARDVVDLALECGVLGRSGKTAVHDAQTGEEWPNVNDCVTSHTQQAAGDDRAVWLAELETRARAAALNMPDQGVAGG